MTREIGVREHNVRCFVPTFIHSFGAFYQRQVHNKCFTITTQALILF